MPINIAESSVAHCYHNYLHVQPLNCCVCYPATCVVHLLFCRRRADFGMLEDPSADLSDEDLLAFVSDMRSTTHTVGESLVTGSLRSRGYRVSRERVRQALRSSDPLSSALRWPGGLTHRRPYSVAGPNSLWHIGKCRI